MAGSLILIILNNNLVFRKLKIHTAVHIILFFFLLAADQITKMLALIHLKDTKAVTVISGILDLDYVQNTGAAFGIFKNSLWIFYLISSVVFLILVFLYVRIQLRLHNYLREQSEPRKKTVRNMILLCYILSVLAAGAVGNLIDRILYGYVIDFLHLRFINFPVFNVADICVTISVILFILFFLFFYREDENFRIFGYKDTSDHKG